MIIVRGTFRLPVDAVEAWKGPAEAMLIATRAEDGCIDYAYALDAIEPGLVHVAEKWRDRAALEAHFAMPHMAEWRAALGDLGAYDRDLASYEVGEGTPI